MKKSILNLRPFLMVILVVFAFACGDDDDSNGNNQPTTEELLVGTWTTSAAEATLTVGGQSLTDYLVSIGESQEDAALASAVYEALLEDAVDGTLTLNADHTYTLEFDQSTENGTWSLSADETTLTMDDGTEEIDFTLNSVTSNTLDLSFADTYTDDLDLDETTPDEEIDAEVDFTLSK